MEKHGRLLDVGADASTRILDNFIVASTSIRRRSRVSTSFHLFTMFNEFYSMLASLHLLRFDIYYVTLSLVSLHYHFMVR